MTPKDIDRAIGDLAVEGPGHVNPPRACPDLPKGFHRSLQARKTAETETETGVRLVCPVDEFNGPRRIGDDSPALPPPTPEREAELFDFIKQRITTARKYEPAARNYAMFRTPYHAGLHSEETPLPEPPDLHPTPGPFGKLHTRFSKGTHTYGPRPRWVPMPDGLSPAPRQFPEDMPEKFSNPPVLSADKSGRPLQHGTIHNRLRYLMELEGRPPAEQFSPHTLQRARTTHNYEHSTNPVAIQQPPGHRTVTPTTQYVRPCTTFLKNAGSAHKLRRRMYTTSGGIPAGPRSLFTRTGGTPPSARCQGGKAGRPGREPGPPHMRRRSRPTHAM
ncbi:site-specific integrase [Kitasatospora sp. NPDC056138]|uniref:site-specific integrase n=1 Tax=Kitasatospora sp. NPDC056138 TaxID=3345724 RepID=UPI0035DF6B65